MGRKWSLSSAAPETWIRCSKIWRTSPPAPAGAGRWRRATTSSGLADEFARTPRGELHYLREGRNAKRYAEPLVARAERLGNRLIAGVLAAAFINGPAKLMAVDPARWHTSQRPLFAVGFAAAGTLAGYAARGANRAHRC